MTTDVTTFRRGSTSSPFVASTVAVMSTVVALFLAALVFQTSDGEALRTAELDHRRATLDVAHTSMQVERAASDEVARRLLEGLGHPSVIVGDRAAEAITELEALALLGGDVGRSAQRIAGAIEAAGGIEHADVSGLVGIIEVAAAARFRVAAGADEVVAAADRTVLPSRLALGGIAAHVSASAPTGIPLDVDPGELIDLAVASPHRMAQPAPGVDAPLFDRLDLVLLEHGLPAQHAELERIAAGELAHPTLGPIELVDASTAAATELSSTWSAGAEALVDGLDADERESDLRRYRFRLAGWSLVLLAGAVLIGVLIAALLRRRGGRSAERRTPSDGPSRVRPGGCFLDVASFRRENVRLLTDPRFDQHLFAVVRVARVEMITDAYGSSGTDRVERLVMRRLQRACAWLGGGRADTAAIVARRRAGEYDVVIHSSRSIDVDLVRRVLLLRSGTAIPVGNDHVPVSYTVGLHLQLGPGDVDEAFDAAERASLHRAPARDLAPRPIDTPLALVRP